MFDSRVATAVRTALVAACIGTTGMSVVSACSSSPSPIRAATTSPAATSGSTPTTASALDSGIYGDPAAAAKYWVQQSLEDTCGLASVADVVGEVTGHTPTEGQIIKVAQNTPSSIRNGPIYLPTGDPGHETEKGGIDMADTVVLLDHYGIKSHMTYDKHPEEVGLSKLEEYLGADRKVIAWVNSGTILGSNDQRTSADHLLVVTGIDTNKEIVHLNDPYADYADTKVSIGTFMTAWKIGQESITVTAAPG
ncbi:C39 family peptidase [Mycobacterium numidiamassiliense]|uniref:C39 family peptidase n=1 Tax=Mycobacterium numidiamassiliense TaxID=1841861 RepID=UPI00097CF5F4|nr:C39 family peptidase [Mycobacterium numidiamassiliense]